MRESSRGSQEPFRKVDEKGENTFLQVVPSVPGLGSLVRAGWVTWGVGGQISWPWLLQTLQPGAKGQHRPPDSLSLGFLPLLPHRWLIISNWMAFCCMWFGAACLQGHLSLILGSGLT